MAQFSVGEESGRWSVPHEPGPRGRSAVVDVGGDFTGKRMQVPGAGERLSKVLDHRVILSVGEPRLRRSELRSSMGKKMDVAHADSGRLPHELASRFHQTARSVLPRHPLEPGRITPTLPGGRMQHRRASATWHDTRSCLIAGWPAQPLPSRVPQSLHRPQRWLAPASGRIPSPTRRRMSPDRAGRAQ